MRNKIGVLFLAEALHPGGAERQMELLLTHLDRAKFEPYLMTWVDAGQAYTTDKNYEWIQHLRKHKFDFSPILKAKKMLKEGRIQVIHGMLDTGNLYGGILKLWHKKVALVASERSSHRELSFFQKIHKPYMHKVADVTVANSLKGIDFLKSLGLNDANNLQFIPNGLDTDIFHPVRKEEKQRLKKEVIGKNGDKKILLFVGSIYPVKNQLGVVKAFAAANMKQTKLVLVGKHDMEYVEQVKAAITELNLENQVTVFPPQRNIHQWFKAADCLILNSIFEGTPNVVLEAMASGLPVIATKVGDIPKYIDSSFSWALQSEDQAHLTRILQEIDQLPSENLEARGKKAFEKIERLGLGKQQLVQKHEQLYLDLVQQLNP